MSEDSPNGTFPLSRLARPTGAEKARSLVAASSNGVLATSARDPAGHPYGAHVNYALVEDRPVFLLSALAVTTRNLEADPRASLLVIEQGRPGEEVAALERVTLLGRCVRVDRAVVEGAFLARRPAAEVYASFIDFAYWALEVESARYVGPFEWISLIDKHTWRHPAPDPRLG